MQIGLRQFENEVVKWFKTGAGGNDHSRYGLAKELRTRADWRNSSAKYCLTQANLALPKQVLAINKDTARLCIGSERMA